MRRTTIRAASVLIVMLAGFGCSGGEDDDSSSTAAGPGATSETEPSAAGEADPTATLRLATNVPPGQWDPHAARGDFELQFMTPVYDRLFRIDGESHEIVPQLATGYEMSDDARTLTVTLRDDVTFPDGTPFDAGVVLANMEAARAGVGAAYLEGVEVVQQDDHTVVFELAAPDTTFVTTLAYQVSLGSMVSLAGLADPEALQATPAGSGLYELVSQTQDRAVYAKRSEYWDAERLATQPAGIEILQIGDDNARLSALQSGQLDAMSVVGVIPNLDQVTADGSIVAQADPASYLTVTVYVNFDNPALAEPEVRQALSLATDREAIAETIFAGQCSPSDVPLPEGSLGYTDEASELQYDPDQARTLLEEAGHSDLSLTMVYQPGVNEQVGTALQAQWAEVGVDLQLEPIQQGSVTVNWLTGDFDLVPSMFGGLPDPGLTIDDGFVGRLMPGGTDPGLAELMEPTQALDRASPEAGEAFEEITTYLDENPVNLVLCSRPALTLQTPRVVGMEHQTFSRLVSLIDTYTLYMTSE